MTDIHRGNLEWLWLLLLTVALVGWQMAAGGAATKPADKKKPFPGAAPPFKPKKGKGK